MIQSIVKNFLFYSEYWMQKKKGFKNQQPIDF